MNLLKLYIYSVISIIIHEALHIIMAKILKINLKNLRVHIFGASIEFENKLKYKSLRKIFVYLAGPISNFIFALISYYINSDIQFVYTNLLIAAFNLLPILPLDGANILMEVFKIKLNFVKASKIILIISKICLSIIAFLYSLIIIKIKNIFIFGLIIYLIYLNCIEEKKIKQIERVYKIINNNLFLNEEKCCNKF